LPGRITAGCGGYGDVFTIPVIIGDGVVVTADTTATATAADLGAAIFSDLAAPWSTVLASGDDDFTCTFPPPSYSCPEFAWTSTLAGTVYVAVYAVGSCADPALVEYELTVTVDDTAVTPTFVADDQLLE
jgi:hypothetical protein